MSLAITSALRWVLWGALTIVFGLLVGLTGIIHRPTSFVLSRIWAKAMLRAAGIEIEINGADAISDSKGAIFVSNHHSYVDILAVIATFPVNVYFVYKSALLILPGLNIAMPGQGHIMVSDKKASGSAKKMLKKGKKYLESGKNLVIFPGGGLSHDESVGDFKGGAAALALFAGVNVTPFSISGARLVLPRGNWPLKPGKLAINIGNSVSVEGMTIRDREKLNQTIREKVEEMKKKGDKVLGVID